MVHVIVENLNVLFVFVVDVVVVQLQQIHWQSIVAANQVCTCVCVCVCVFVSVVNGPPLSSLGFVSSLSGRLDGRDRGTFQIDQDLAFR